MPPSFTDITGKRFGRLVALWPVGRDGRRNHVWLFRCDCGRFKPIRLTNVTGLGVRSSNRSCGCQRGINSVSAAEIGGAKKFVNLEGRKFGRLRVMEYVEKRHYPSGACSHIYRCLCRCGRVKLVTGEALKSGNTKSCGCLRRETTAKTAIQTHRRWAADKERKAA